MSRSTISKIEEDLLMLSSADQLYLLERMIHRLRKADTNQRTQLFSWQELYGIGKDVWKDKDAQEYINEIRDDRSCH